MIAVGMVRGTVDLDSRSEAGSRRSRSGVCDRRLLFLYEVTFDVMASMFSLLRGVESFLGCLGEYGFLYWDRSGYESISRPILR